MLYYVSGYLFYCRNNRITTNRNNKKCKFLTTVNLAGWTKIICGTDMAWGLGVTDPWSRSIHSTTNPLLPATWLSHWQLNWIPHQDSLVWRVARNPAVLKSRPVKE